MITWFDFLMTVQMYFSLNCLFICNKRSNGKNKGYTKNTRKLPFFCLGKTGDTTHPNALGIIVHSTVACISKDKGQISAPRCVLMLVCASVPVCRSAVVNCLVCMHDPMLLYDKNERGGAGENEGLTRKHMKHFV